MLGSPPLPRVDILFPMDTGDVDGAIREISGTNWKLLGINLGIPLEDLEDIDSETTKIKNKKAEMIQIWMTGENRPTWPSLVDSLRSRSILLNQAAERVSKEHRKFTNP